MKSVGFAAKSPESSPELHHEHCHSLLEFHCRTFCAPHKGPSGMVCLPLTVVSKLITDRYVSWENFQLQIQNRAARSINSITETDLWEPRQKIPHYRCRFSLEFQVPLRPKFLQKNSLQKANLEAAFLVAITKNSAFSQETITNYYKKS